MFEVQESFKLGQDTLFCAISYLRRFLACTDIPRSELQLAGTTVLFLASKMEELRPRPVADFVYIAADTYTREQIFAMEKTILKALEFKVWCFRRVFRVFFYITKTPSRCCFSCWRRCRAIFLCI
jgi:hypothetical protein